MAVNIHTDTEGVEDCGLVVVDNSSAFDLGNSTSAESLAPKDFGEAYIDHISASLTGLTAF